MLAAHGPVQDPTSVRPLVIVLVIAAIVWWRVTLLIIAVLLIIVLGYGAVAFLHGVHHAAVR